MGSREGRLAGVPDLKRSFRRSLSTRLAGAPPHPSFHGRTRPVSPGNSTARLSPSQPRSDGETVRGSCSGARVPAGSGPRPRPSRRRARRSGSWSITSARVSQTQNPRVRDSSFSRARREASTATTQRFLSRRIRAALRSRTMAETSWAKRNSCSAGPDRARTSPAWWRDSPISMARGRT